MTDLWAQALLRACGALIPAVLAIVYLRQRKGKGALGKWVSILVIVLSSISAVHVVATNLVATKLAPVQVKVISQSVLGAKSSDLDQQYLNQIEESLLVGIRAGVPESQFTGRSTIIEKDGQRLGVVRIDMNGKTPIVTAFKIADGKVIRVTCGVPDERSVDYHDAACAEALRSNLGTVLD